MDFAVLLKCDAAPFTKEKMCSVELKYGGQEHGVKSILTLNLSELIHNNFINCELS